jgi:hypothetical protein
MNDEMKKISDEAFDAAFKKAKRFLCIGDFSVEMRAAIYAACDAVLAAQQMPVPGQVTKSQILAAQMAWHQAELDGRVSIDSRDELRSRKIIEVVAPYVQYTQAQQVTLEGLRQIIYNAIERHRENALNEDALSAVVYQAIERHVSSLRAPEDGWWKQEDVEKALSEIWNTLAIRQPLDSVLIGLRARLSPKQERVEVINRGGRRVAELEALLREWQEFPFGCTFEKKCECQRCNLYKRTDALLGGE